MSNYWKGIQAKKPDFGPAKRLRRYIVLKIQDKMVDWIPYREFKTTLIRIDKYMPKGTNETLFYYQGEVDVQPRGFKDKVPSYSGTIKVNLWIKNGKFAYLNINYLDEDGNEYWWSTEKWTDNPSAELMWQGCYKYIVTGHLTYGNDYKQLDMPCPFRLEIIQHHPNQKRLF